MSPRTSRVTRESEGRWYDRLRPRWRVLIACACIVIILTLSTITAKKLYLHEWTAGSVFAIVSAISWGAILRYGKSAWQACKDCREIPWKELRELRRTARTLMNALEVPGSGVLVENTGAVLDALAAIREEDFVASVRTTASAWRSLLDKEPARSKEEVRRLLLALLRRYAEEEQTDISGNAYNKGGTPIIVTNFVAYAGLVRSVVECSKRLAPPGDQPVYLTTLTMPLYRWFNFKRLREGIDETGPGRPWVGGFSHARWDDYLSFMHELRNADLTRCVLCTKHPDPDNVILPTNDQLQSCKLKILVEIDQDTRIVLPKPYNPIELENLFTNSNNRYSFPATDSESRARFLDSVRSEFQARGASGERFYPIVRTEPFRADGNGTYPCFCWKTLSEVFTECFHEIPSNAPLLELLPQQFRTYFVSPRLPEDFFLVGMRREGQPGEDWLLALAADESADKDMICLELHTQLDRRMQDFIALIRRGQAAGLGGLP